MASNFSISAILSAKDNGFSSTLKSAMKTTDSLSSKLTSGFNFGILTGAGQQFFSTLTNGARDLLGEMSSASAAWQTFEDNMKTLKVPEKDIAAAKKEMQSFATQTIYSASDMANTYAQLKAVGVSDTEELVKAFGGLAAASENPQQAMKTLSQQATQMAAKPKVAWADFKLMLEQSPAGIAAVAAKMGMSTSKLVTAVQDGKVSTTKFFKAVREAGGAGSEFEKMATKYKTVGQAMDGLKETMTNVLMPAFNTLSSKAISAIDSIITAVGSDDFANKLNSIAKSISKYWNAAKSAFSGVGKAISDAFSAIKTALGDVTGAFGSTKSVDTFKERMQMLANAIKSVAGFFEKHAATIAKIIPVIGKLAGAFIGLKVLNSIPGVSFLVRGIGALGKVGIGAIANKISSLGKNAKTASEGAGELGSTSVQTGANMLKSAQSFALMGVAVLLIAAGFALLAQSAIALAGAGAPAIAVMAGLVVAVAALGFGMGALLKWLAPMGPQLITAATAMVVMAAAVLIIAVAFGVLAGVAILISNAGTTAIAVMFGLIVAVAALLGVAALCAPALTAGAAGFTAFGTSMLMVGAAFLLVGVAAVLAAAALLIITMALPMLVAFGAQGAIVILQLAGAMTLFAVGAALVGIALVTVAAGLLLVGAGALVAAVGVLLLAAGALLLGAGLQIMANALTIIAMTMPLAAAGALLLTASFTLLMAMVLIISATLAIMVIALAGLGIAAAASAIGIAAFGIAMAAAAIGVAAMAVGLLGVTAEMKSISKNAKSAEKSLKSMKKSVKVVEGGLKAIGSTAKSAMKSLTDAFDNTASKAQSSGKKVASSFAKGLNSGYPKAYTAGAYISAGFAQGMLSQLGIIEAAASRMAAAADKAVRAKAQIHSPSRVAMGLGAYWGEGYAEGLSNMIGKVHRAAQDLVSVPQVMTPDLAFAYGGEMSADFDYYRNAEYTIVVPVEVDGKEVARTTAPYMQSELDRNQTRSDRKHGKA